MAIRWRDFGGWTVPQVLDLYQGSGNLLNYATAERLIIRPRNSGIDLRDAAPR